MLQTLPPQWALFLTRCTGCFLIEVFLRLGLALLLSMSLAVLLAWGWYSSDRAAIGPETTVSAAASQAPTSVAKPVAPAVSTE